MKIDKKPCSESELPGGRDIVAARYGHTTANTVLTPPVKAVARGR
ncbi:hypothetical protein ACWIG5_22255 [Streptomyces lydicus]